VNTFEIVGPHSDATQAVVHAARQWAWATQALENPAPGTLAVPTIRALNALANNVFRAVARLDTLEAEAAQGRAT
jgi:hypothetical protein